MMHRSMLATAKILLDVEDDIGLLVRSVEEEGDVDQDVIENIMDFNFYSKLFKIKADEVELNCFCQKPRDSNYIFKNKLIGYINILMNHLV